MKIIDLTAPIYHHMPVYPGDPELEIEQVDTYEKTKINMARLHINTHDGTHVNAPFHMDNDGKKIDGYGLESFCGPCLLDTITSDKGVIIRGPLTQEIFDKIVKRRSPFVGFDHTCEGQEVDLERKLCEAGIISFEGLINCDQLPDEFFFHGAPLPIREGDGSPVRAYAVVE